MLWGDQIHAQFRGAANYIDSRGMWLIRRMPVRNSKEQNLHRICSLTLMFYKTIHKVGFDFCHHTIQCEVFQHRLTSSVR